MVHLIYAGDDFTLCGEDFTGAEEEEGYLMPNCEECLARCGNPAITQQARELICQPT